MGCCANNDQTLLNMLQNTQFGNAGNKIPNLRSVIFYDGVPDQ